MTDSKCKNSPASGHVTVGGVCEYDHETWGFINCILYYDQLTGSYSTLWVRIITHCVRIFNDKQLHAITLEKPIIN